MPSNIFTSIGKTAALLPSVLDAGLVPLIAGSPGIGKSAIVQALADEYELQLIDLRLAQCDPTDLLGFPYIDKKTGRAKYVPMETFPLAGDPLPPGKNGWLLFLDEMTSADRGVQKAAYKLLLDRMVGNHHLHPNVALVGAGNLATDNAIVEEMSTALQSRLIHFQTRVDHKEWIDWATRNGVDYRVTSYINFRPDSIYTFKPDHVDNTYACPRTWEFASNLLQHFDEDSPEALPVLAGTLSEGVAREFLGFLRIFQGLPQITDIEKAPMNVAVPSEPSTIFATCGLIANNITVNNASPLMQYLGRLGKEFQITCVREMFRRDPKILENPDVDLWAQTNAAEIF